MFESRVLRRIFGPKGDEVLGEWRTLRIEQLNDFYTSQNVIGVIESRRMRWADHVARMGNRRHAYWVLVGNPDGQGPLGRP